MRGIILAKRRLTGFPSGCCRIMSESKTETPEWYGILLVATGVVLLLLPVAAVFIGIPREKPGDIPIRGEAPLFNAIEGLFASVLLGGVLLLMGIAESQKSRQRFSLRILLITITIISVVLGLVVWIIKSCT
jgi:hypothetical protein